MANPTIASMIENLGTRMHYLAEDYLYRGKEPSIPESIREKLRIIDRQRTALSESELIVHDYLMKSSRDDSPDVFVMEVFTKCCSYGL